MREVEQRARVAGVEERNELCAGGQRVDEEAAQAVVFDRAALFAVDDYINTEGECGCGGGGGEGMGGRTFVVAVGLGVAVAGALFAVACVWAPGKG